MFPWKSVIQIQSPCSTPVYLQIANAVIREVKQGRVQPGARLPGTRIMSGMLEVHRKTVVAAYEELEAQGWIEVCPSKGAFVHRTLPEKKAQALPTGLRQARSGNGDGMEQTGFPVLPYDNVHEPTYAPTSLLGFHDGPDLRLVPTALIGRTYKGVITRRTNIHHLRYYEVEGNPNLRLRLSEYLNESRGLQTTPKNIFITRGSSMAIYLAAMALLTDGDAVITGDPAYYYADRTFTHFGAKLLRVPVDGHGIRTDAVEDLCKRERIRLLYVTPHHHFPTTVTLCAARRMELLALSAKYGFVILEDDYDFDFQYETSPLLPLASADSDGMVVYVGSMSKTFAPFLRVGFLVAPKNLMDKVARLRQIIDVQGDYMLEQTVAELFYLGEIKRHMKKALKIYKQRRDVFCQLFQEKLGDRVQFKKPDGGMAVWAQFDPALSLPEISERARKQGLVISNGLIYDKASERKWNATRMGFACVNEGEIERAMNVLEKVVREI